MRVDETMVLPDRFWSKVSITNNCWEWTGAKTKGYGVMRLNGRNVYAHRLLYESINGPIPNGLNALHKCDNPSCVNPSHVFIGTQKENVADMYNKGRRLHGKEFSNGKCKLSNEIIEKIQRNENRLSNRQIAKMYGIDRSYASRIKNKIRRANV